MQIGRAVAVAAACVLAVGCRGDRSPSPPTTPSTAAATTTTARVPVLTGDPIPSIQPSTIHGNLQNLGFAVGAPATAPGFVTTTSTRTDATVTTYGKGPDDVVKIIAQADSAAAATVLPPVAAALLNGSEARRARIWVTAELKKGAKSPTEPRTTKATYGQQPYELLITTTTATLSIGRLTD